MTEKEKKRASELEAMIWDEVHRHRDWSRIVGVAITRVIEPSPDGATWFAAFVTGRNAAPIGAKDFARELALRFDLV